MLSGRVYCSLALLAICITQGASYVRICYFTSWSLERPHNNARISWVDIDASLCTHLILAFADVDVTSKTLVPNSNLFTKFNRIKEKNPDLKTLLSIGGQLASREDKFEAISETEESISTFARNVAVELESYGFDGVDIDWEYPTADTKSNFTKLIKALREEFDKAGNGPHKLVTAAVSAGEHIISVGYNISEVSKYLDYFIIMAYDFFGTWSEVAGFNSPLFPRSDPKFSPLYNVEYAVKVWLDGGADPNRVVVGTTGAGASFKLSNSSNNEVGAAVEKGGGDPGPFFEVKGRLFLAEICENLSNGWTREWDEEQQVPYAYRGDNWVGYEDTQSITSKAEFIKTKGLGGVMFWEVSFDDPHEVCGLGKYPLLTAVRDELNRRTTTESTATSTVGSNSGSTCAVNLFIILNVCFCITLL